MVNDLMPAPVVVDAVTTRVLEKGELTIPAASARGDLPPYWEKEYITERLGSMPSGRHKMLCLFLWLTGCRITEALSVRRRDLDFQHYTVRVRWLKSRKYKERIVPLHPRLRDMLEVYSGSMLQGDLLFPISRQRAYQLVQRYFGGNPHMFRHSFAVNWLRCGGRLEILSRALGHSDIRHTMVYLALVPQDVGAELQKITFD